jgi:hypothetical protein
MAREPEIGRYEIKYVLPASCRQEVVGIISPHVFTDPHAAPLEDGTIGYHVHSLYLDTPRLDDYCDRLARRRVRNRLRVRTYGRPGERQPVFLENKRKSGKWVVKHRVRVSDADQWCSSQAERPWTELARQINGRGEYAARSFLDLVDGRRRQPVSVVHYLREVFVPRDPVHRDVRLTLDRRVCATLVSDSHRLYADPDMDLIPSGWMVMELKFARHAPGWMRALCRELGVQAVPVSKFGLSVARGLRADRPHELRFLTPAPILRRSRAA